MGLIPKVPEDLKKLLAALPGVAVNSISYPELLKAMVKTGKNYLRRQPASVQSFLIDKSQIGDVVLEIYFSQLQNPEGLYLDLRSSHFAFDEKLIWQPSPLFHQFENNFLEGLNGLYKGYYSDDEALFMGSLDKLGLTAGCNEQEKFEIRDLFYSHFGGSTDAVQFSFQKFSDSFSRIFEFLNRKKIKVSIDFVYLGIYLTTLYKHLSEYDQAFNVRRAYLNSQPGKARSQTTLW